MRNNSPVLRFFCVWQHMWVTGLTTRPPNRSLAPARDAAGSQGGTYDRHKIEIPGANLVVTMEQLSEWGPGMGVALVLCCGFSLGLIPSAVAYKSLPMVLVCVSFAFLPICILLAPAQVSSVCDDMLDQLNDCSYLGDSAHKERCTHMRHSFTNLNRAQGLGFKMFSTVIDMRMLAKLGLAMGTSSVTVITALAAIGSGDTAMPPQGNVTHT